MVSTGSRRYHGIITAADRRLRPRITPHRRVAGPLRCPCSRRIALDPQVASFFGALAQAALLPRLQVTAVRLLGCETAVTDAGQRTLRMLSQTLRLPVFGTRKPLLKSHCTSAGFDPAFAHILTVSRPPGTPFSR